jgi:hypothetical protein
MNVPSAPVQEAPRELAPPRNVLPLDRGTLAEPPPPAPEVPLGRLGDDYPPVVELAPEPVLPDLTPSIAPPPVEAAEPMLPRNSIPTTPRLPKNAIPRSSR